MAEPAVALGACMEALGAAAAQPERFLSVQEGLASDFTLLTKTLYDFHKALGADVLSGSPLKELVIDNFDEEQIWQQLELQNNAVLGYFKKAVARNVKEEQELFLLPELEEDASVTGDSEKQTDNEEELEEHEDQSEEVSDHKSDHLEEECELETRRTQHRTVEGTKETFSDEDSDMDFDIDKFEQQTQISKSTMKKRGEPSILDDRFFKLSEMEAVLDAAEKMENKERDEDEDDGIDYFDDVLSEDEDEEEEFGEAKMKLSKSARDLKYQDYFDPVDDPEDFTSEHKDDRSEGADSDTEYSSGTADETEEMDGIEQAQTEKNKELSKRVTFALPYDSDMEEDTDTFQGKADSSPEMKSSFEKRQEKMGAKIKSLEEELLKEKPWQLKGEVTGQKRPENSLLEETLLFDHAVRMAPVITEETTLELEDIIKRRIKDQRIQHTLPKIKRRNILSHDLPVQMEYQIKAPKPASNHGINQDVAWDDVVRKERAREDPYEYKKRLTLDHEKSKQSLAEIYEQEYLKLNQKKSDEEEKPEHTEIQKMMDSLFLKLDALSNFHFTPKPPVPEVKIVSNLPAITMEEVAPVSISDAALLAPEEIKGKNKGGDIKTDAEKTSTDKKRERRKKKLAKRMRLKEREKRQKLLEQKSEQGAKMSKKVSAGQLKKLTKDGRTSLLKDDGKDKALKSSKAFFSQLQDQVKMQIKDAKKSQKKPRKRELSAQKLKL